MFPLMMMQVVVVDVAVVVHLLRGAGVVVTLHGQVAVLTECPPAALVLEVLGEHGVILEADLGIDAVAIADPFLEDASLWKTQNIIDVINQKLQKYPSATFICVDI